LSIKRRVVTLFLSLLEVVYLKNFLSRKKKKMQTRGGSVDYLSSHTSPEIQARTYPLSGRELRPPAMAAAAVALSYVGRAALQPRRTLTQAEQTRLLGTITFFVWPKSLFAI
jgi:hypothetical protein